MSVLLLLLAGSLQGADATVEYLMRARKANGAFGPHRQEYTDLAWNYPAVKALAALGRVIPRPEDCLKNGLLEGGRTPYWSFAQKSELQRLLGVPRLSKEWTVAFRPKRGYGGRIDPGKDAQAFHSVSTLSWLVQGGVAAGISIANPDEVARFLAVRQTPGGGFSDLAEPAEAAKDDQAHLVYTAHAVLALVAVERKVARAERCAAWLRSCQEESGGFRWHPSASPPSNVADVWYTWVAVRALKALGTVPRDPEACVRWINSLRNGDGGFGDRPGWRSRLYSTMYAIETLHLLTGDARKAIKAGRPEAPPTRPLSGNEWKVFQAHFKSPHGDVAMVDIVREMKFGLLGVKQLGGKEWDAASAELLAKIRRHASEKNYRLELVACPELYNHRLRVAGGGVGDHVANTVFPPGVTLDNEVAGAADRAGSKALPWERYKAEVIRPLVGLGSLFYPEHEFDMVFGHQAYDDRILGGQGYNAVHAGHMNGPDRIRLYPWRERYEDRLPFLADGDAHGDIAEWKPKLEQFRTLYIARSHRFADFMDACRNGRTVCVIRDPRVPSGIVYYGPPAAVAFVKERRALWQWW